MLMFPGQKETPFLLHLETLSITYSFASFMTVFVSLNCKWLGYSSGCFSQTVTILLKKLMEWFKHHHYRT